MPDVLQTSSRLSGQGFGPWPATSCVRSEGVEPSTPGPSSRSVFPLRHERVRVCVTACRRALGESRTHTRGVLNAVPLPLGYEGRKSEKPPESGISPGGRLHVRRADGQGVAASGHPSRHRHRRQHSRVSTRYILGLLRSVGFVRLGTSVLPRSAHLQVIIRSELTRIATASGRGVAGLVEQGARRQTTTEGGVRVHSPSVVTASETDANDQARVVSQLAAPRPHRVRACLPHSAESSLVLSQMILSDTRLLSPRSSTL